MNTLFTYQYRDGGNNKTSRDVIFRGTVTDDMMRRFRSMMIPSETGSLGDIIPGQVGLRDLQDGFYEREIEMIDRLLSPDEWPARPVVDEAFGARLAELREQMKATLPKWHPDLDHILHEVVALEETDREATDPRDFGAFVNEVIATDWDSGYRPPFHERMVANYEADLNDHEP